MIFKTLMKINEPDFKEALTIYHEAFPPEEQQSEENLQSKIISSQGQFLVAKEKNKVIAMAIIWKLSKTNLILLEYFAVHTTYQGSGIGTSLIKHILKIVKKENQSLVAEIENPLLGNNTTKRQQRMKFYTKNGFKQIKGLKSYIPSLNGTKPTEVILMTNTLATTDQYSGSEMTQMILSIFTELYHLPESDSLVQLILADIPEQCPIN